jgi:hypothetical protein
MLDGGIEIEIRVEDARRCARLRGLSVRDCACKLDGGGWQDCPPAAQGALLDAGVVADVLRMLETVPAAARRSRAAPTPVLPGDLCLEPGCGGFLVQTGTCRTCQSCGANEGCS